MNIIQDFKYQLRHGNTIMRLLMFNVLFFLIQTILIIIFYLAGYKDEFVQLLSKWLWLSTDISVAITKPWTYFTYMFLHDPVTIFHVLANMLYLFFFGRIFIEFTQQKNAIPLYFAGGIIGALIAQLVYLFSPVAHEHIGVPMVGASAAVMAIVIGAATLAPDYSVMMIFIGPVKLKYIALLVVIIDLLSIPAEYNIGGHSAHLGGALSGFLFIKAYQSGRDVFGWWFKISDKIKTIFSKKKKQNMKIHYRNMEGKKPSQAPIELDEQKKLDTILDKISTSGYDSLTAKEKEFLFSMSNRK